MGYRNQKDKVFNKILNLIHQLENLEITLREFEDELEDFLDKYDITEVA